MLRASSNEFPSVSPAYLLDSWLGWEITSTFVVKMKNQNVTRRFRYEEPKCDRLWSNLLLDLFLFFDWCEGYLDKIWILSAAKGDIESVVLAAHQPLLCPTLLSISFRLSRISSAPTTAMSDFVINILRWVRRSSQWGDTVEAFPFLSSLFRIL